MQLRPRLLRLPGTLDLNGHSRSQLYREIKEGLFPPPVKLGGARLSASAWPEHEVLAINNARIAGRSNDEIRGLVRKLLAERSLAA